MKLSLGTPLNASHNQNSKLILMIKLTLNLKFNIYNKKLNGYKKFVEYIFEINKSRCNSL